MATLGLLVTVFAALLFFWYINPLRRLHTSDWVRHHSRREVCAEVFASVSRFGWTHDETLQMARCGDETWAAHILENPRLEKLLGRFDGHVGGALQVITNQDLPETDARAWRQWWAANRHLSQADWVRDGFRRGGLVVHAPLTIDDRRSLLAVLSRPKGHPPGWSYNSFCFLRDGGFRPWRDASVSDLGSPPDDLVLQGLLRYTRWLSSEVEDDSVAYDSAFVQPYFTFFVLLALLVSALLCVAFFLRLSPRARGFPA